MWANMSVSGWLQQIGWGHEVCDDQSNHHSIHHQMALSANHRGPGQCRTCSCMAKAVEIPRDRESEL